MIRFDAGKRLRVLDVVPVEEEGSPFTGLLKVEPLSRESAKRTLAPRERIVRPRSPVPRVNTRFV
jgi:hypothetical protein